MELVKEFEGNFECLGENTEKYITFSVPIKKKMENEDLVYLYILDIVYCIVLYCILDM